MLLLKDAVAFGREEPANLLHCTRCRPLVLKTPEILNGSEVMHISLCGLTPRPSLAPLSARCLISSSHGAHSSMPLLAEIVETRWGKPDQGKLLLRRFDGSIALDIPAPPLREGSLILEVAGYTDCQFDDRGRHLWCAARVSSDQIEVQLRETDGWSVVSRTLVEGGYDSALFFRTPDPGTLSLWFAEGEACVYWAARDGVHTRYAPEPSLYGTTPPEFSPSGREFLVIDSVYGGVQRYRFPVVQLLGACESPFGADEPFDVSLCYLTDTQALAGSLNGRIAVLDTPTMRVVNELTIEGHEPRPVEEYHPTLTGNGELCTDIASFARLGDYLIFWHGPGAPSSDGSRHVEVGTETKGMLCFPVSYILDRYAP